MTTLATRKEIVESKKVIGSELVKMQKAFYDEVDLQLYKDDNEEHLYLEQFDCLKNEEVQIENHSKLIGLKHSDIKTYTIKLADKLRELFRTINANEFYIISHLKLDFFGNRTNKFKPLVSVYKKLEKVVGLNSYKEAFRITEQDIPDWIDILFWISRCDAGASEYIFLFDENEKIQIHLCKYGNIHLTEFGDERLSERVLTSLGWTIIDGEEFDKFTREVKIAGRQIRI